MTQLSLFDAIAPISPVVASAPVTSAPVTSAPVVAAPQANDNTPSGSNHASHGTDNSLLALAELIRQGREQLESQRASTERPIQRIGDLAQAVLRRHDLVARRRAASQQKANDFDAADDNVQVAS
ncbi:MAG: hypothetical protein ACF8AM_20125 [Rhodopirellula sp. JB055]|uniref:hypothetical protein n=1 Tax=Rhodopirellula sp. JB055 TaxID=3342846 RepID=UPI00370CA561